MYISIFLVLVLAVSLPFLISLVPNPSCTDGKQNQNERGVDCGGPCTKVCVQDVAPVANLWTRPFKVAEGVYSIVAFVSNPNTDVLARNVPYDMKLYDKKNILIAERRGVTDILPKSDFPIFEGGIQTNKAEVGEAFFEFSETPVWEKVQKEQPKISVGAPNVTTEGSPKVVVSIRNESYEALKNVPIDVVVFNKEGNALGASETTVDSLKKNESAEVVFTWLLPFADEVSRVAVYPKGVR